MHQLHSAFSLKKSFIFLCGKTLIKVITLRLCFGISALLWYWQLERDTPGKGEREDDMQQSAWTEINLGSFGKITALLSGVNSTRSATAEHRQVFNDLQQCSLQVLVVVS